MNKSEVVEMEPSCDLSGQSVFRAMELYRSKFGIIVNNYCCISCASQNIKQASVISSLLGGVYLEINPDYLEDEWSFDVSSFVGNDYLKRSIHSMGA